MTIAGQVSYPALAFGVWGGGRGGRIIHTNPEGAEDQKTVSLWPEEVKPLVERGMIADPQIAAANVNAMDIHNAVQEVTKGASPMDTISATASTDRLQNLAGAGPAAFDPTVPPAGSAAADESGRPSLHGKKAAELRIIAESEGLELPAEISYADMLKAIKEHRATGGGGA